MICLCLVCHTVKNEVDMKDKDICESCFYSTLGGVNPADSRNKKTKSASKAGGLSGTRPPRALAKQLRLF